MAQILDEEVTALGDKMKELFALLNPTIRINNLLEERDSIIQPRDIDGKFHPSSFGGCARKLSYAWLKETPSHRIGNSLRRVFSHGHAIHDMLQGWMSEAYNGDIEGYTCTFEAELSITGTDLAKAYNIAGSADGLIVLTRENESIRVIYEAKSASVSSWSGVGSPMPKHIEQANVYAACLGASAILFDYYNKNTDKHKYFLVEFNQELWESTASMLDKVRSQIELGELMPREYSSFECRSCGYYSICQPELNR